MRQGSPRSSRKTKETPGDVAPGEAGTDLDGSGGWTTFPPRLEILPPQQRALWPNLQGASRMGLVLYGGTAIAIRLGHRQSVDFDFFTERTFDHQKLAHKLKVLLQRLEAKDYLDVHALIGSGFRLEDGLAGARAMYGNTFQPAQALKSLTWFQGGNLHELPAKVQKDLVAAVAKIQDLPPIPETHPSLGGGAE